MKKISPEMKNKMLVAGLIPLMWMIYAFALKPTFELRNEYNKLQLQLDSSAGAPARMQQVESELKKLESEIEESNTVSFHEQLLDQLTNYCRKNELILRDFAPPVIYHVQEMRVETHPVKVEGTYVQLLKLVHYLEKTKKGKVVSVDFFSKRDSKTQILSLTATIYVQNIVRNS
jgi:hypothetical protein